MRGFSLVELMVCLLIEMFLLALILNITVRFQAIIQNQMGLLRAQQQALIALTVFNHEIEHAGYWGCQHLPPGKGAQLQGSSLTINHLAIPGLRLISMPNQKTLVVLSRHMNPKLAWQIIDCAHHESLDIQSIQKHAKQMVIKLKKPLKYLYLKHSLISYPERVKLYLKKGNLMLAHRQEPPQILLEGIKRLKIYAKQSVWKIQLKCEGGQYEMESKARNLL